MPAAIITDGALWGRAFVPWQKRHFRPRDPFGREWVALPGAEEQIAADFGTVAMTVADEDMPDLPPLNVVVTPLKLPDAVMATYRTMAAGAVRHDRRALDRGRLAADRDRQAGAARQRLPLRRRQRRSGFRAQPEDRLAARAGREPRRRAAAHRLRVHRGPAHHPARLRGGAGARRSTPAREAAQLVADWNAGKLPLLAFHPASAGHGLNLQHGGSRMAWLSPSWSAELTEQAIARLYRPGQTQHVTIHVCVAAGTVDEMKRDRVLGKMSAQEAFRRHLEQV